MVRGLENKMQSQLNGLKSGFDKLLKDMARLLEGANNVSNKVVNSFDGGFGG